ncbi:phosphonoacetaldehyde hydrolase [Staphylococcus sp. NRL 16/872]|uniref:phosphonoacetaldehyde hydrolase n=1 Tax=Staphylococcus sp. NRL 16/872 TaxID=2930131 RepID=UPI001FB2313B|nr:MULTISPECIES: phosphonoacetaldehyde hydrolase [unclassified Staphylococcus]MCJ1657254.1 phosphonoacetaldehyde hydrolase [Staphylococcus sp. NRL 21/187]MCJ1662974.1 phosphonoacetaldehyde hydrolase [Staphylococcus sp. NRL 18/288]MCJ1669101.1 phosphonoacetaldehyde hydrolase [Staphylococcus sp. NRL 19/737]WEN69339.1 phosphonoacetaldehyde hydrolase [Staphylococcus sp. NRL 16/872]
MSNIKGIIFDWAGTTIDFGCFAPVQVFVEIFKNENIDVTIEEAREPMGMLKRDHIEAMLNMDRIANEWNSVKGRPHTQEDIDYLYANFEKSLMETLKDYTTPIPNVIDTINQLRNQGYKIGSTTGYTKSMMEVVTTEAKSKGYSPDYYVTAEAVNGYGRPYPYMIFENMKQLELERVAEVVKVGDTASDMKEAVNAGVIAIGVIKGSSIVGLSEDEWNALSDNEKDEHRQKATEKFKENGALYVIDDITQLPQLLKEI